jgi:molybdopterin-guanine dinucleotide biosynthesis protein A
MERLELLPVAGFVLAGGKSTRMGADKALMHFLGRPMIEIAVEKLLGFCTEVGIAGNRDDLGEYGTVVHEARLEAGPAAGIEAGLGAATQPWVLFLPVDVPLVPMELLRTWVQAEISKEDEEGSSGSYLVSEGQPQPSFCLLRKECLEAWSGLLSKGERRVARLLREARVGAGPAEAERFAIHAEPVSREMEFWFSNVNTPQELAEAEVWALDRSRKAGGGG